MNQRQGEEWLKQRYNAITGTDVAKIIGVDETLSRVKLFDSKCREIDPLANANTYTRDLLNKGLRYEPVAKEDFIKWFKHRGYDVFYTPHDTYKWFCGTPDYIAEDNNEKIVLEIKTHFYPQDNFARPYYSPTQIPLKHWTQVQAYMEILNFQTGMLWSWTIKNGFSCFEIKRDKEFFQKEVMPKLKSFYDLLVHYKPMVDSNEYKNILNKLRFQKGERESMSQVVRTRLLLTTEPLLVATPPPESLDLTSESSNFQIHLNRLSSNQQTN
jgi:predicted phage-related endonuclease